MAHDAVASRKTNGFWIWALFSISGERNRRDIRNEKIKRTLLVAFNFPPLVDLSDRLDIHVANEILKAIKKAFRMLNSGGSQMRRFVDIIMAAISVRNYPNYPP